MRNLSSGAHPAAGPREHHHAERDRAQHARLRRLGRADQAQEDLRHQHAQAARPPRALPLHGQQRQVQERAVPPAGRKLLLYKPCKKLNIISLTNRIRTEDSSRRATTRHSTRKRSARARASPATEPRGSGTASDRSRRKTSGMNFTVF